MTTDKSPSQWEIEKALELEVTIQQLREYEREAKSTLLNIFAVFGILGVGLLLYWLGVFH